MTGPTVFLLVTYDVNTMHYLGAFTTRAVAEAVADELYPEGNYDLEIQELTVFESRDDWAGLRG